MDPSLVLREGGGGDSPSVSVPSLSIRVGATNFISVFAPYYFFRRESSWNSRYLRRAGSCYKTLCRPLTIARERRRWTCLPLAKARDAGIVFLRLAHPHLCLCLFLILRFVLLLHLLLFSTFFTAPPPLLTASLGAASTSSLFARNIKISTIPVVAADPVA